MSSNCHHSEVSFFNQLFYVQSDEIVFDKYNASNHRKDRWGNDVLFFTGYAPYKRDYCPHCHHQEIIKHGTKEVTIRQLELNGHLSELHIRKQRMRCKKCLKTFTPDLSLVDRHCSIGRCVKQKLLLRLQAPVSFVTIARDLNVSVNTVSRTLDQFVPVFKKNKRYLPHHLCFDEFNAGNGTDAAMSFIYTDAKTHRVLDIVEYRHLRFLKEYFMRFNESARLQVQSVTMDMYRPYMQLVHDVFPNAKIIIDKFHVCQHWNRAFQKSRIIIMNMYKSGNAEQQKLYRRIKKYWRFLSLDEGSLVGAEYKKYPLFEGLISQKGIVHYILERVPELKTVYAIYQEFLFCIRYKDMNRLKELLQQSYIANAKEFETPRKTLYGYLDEIQNMFDYSFNNGHLEATNNHIKTLKKVTYGMRNFYRLKQRLMLMFNRITAVY